MEKKKLRAGDNSPFSSDNSQLGESKAPYQVGKMPQANRGGNSSNEEYKIDNSYRDYIKSDLSEDEFRAAAMETFHFQMQNCEPYRRYVELLGVEVNGFDDIPFMPIEFFKSQAVYGFKSEPQVVFTSSGTSGGDTSRHPVASVEIYETSFMQGFKRFYGEPSEYSIFALLPSYLEREGSSLIYMVESLQRQNSEKGGFYLYDFDALADALSTAKQRGDKIMLLGVTFALLDFAESHKIDLRGSIIMETGGMKGRRREVARAELHSVLCDSFNVDSIHSEYGMTEMLSQCYSAGGGLFISPAWVRVSTRSLQNPLQRSISTGGINIIDLANRYSCSFLATGDRGIVHSDGSFEIYGRIENELLRGCNMLTE